MLLTTYEVSSSPQATTRCGEPSPWVRTRLPSAAARQPPICSRIRSIAYASCPGATRNATQLCTMRPYVPSESVGASGSCAPTRDANDSNRALHAKRMLDLLDETLLVPSPMHQRQRRRIGDGLRTG